MVAFLDKFSVGLSEITAPFRNLLRDYLVVSKVSIRGMSSNSFDIHLMGAFAKRLDIMTSSPITNYLDPMLASKMSSDASKTCLGATLEQFHENKRHLVAYASLSMSSMKHYCQRHLEEETLFPCASLH